MRRESITSDKPWPGRETNALLDALPEAALLLSREGVILTRNRASKRFFGDNPIGQPLVSFQEGDDASLARYISRCWGSSSPLIGSLLLVKEGEPQRCRLLGCRVSFAAGAAVLLRMEHRNDEQFAALNQKLSELHREIHERMRAQAILTETVEERELLLRELQHRVKNNMHMLTGLLLGAEREARSDEAKAALRDVLSRVSAIAAVQQLLYSSTNIDAVAAAPLMEAVLKGALALAPDEVATSFNIASFHIPIEKAVTLALIANELLTNAVKYGRPKDGSQKIRIEMTRADQQVTFTISDNGPGFALTPGGKRASGIGLVRGLVRQLGGVLQIEGTGGTKCLVSFPLPKNERRDLSR